jgi:predicted aspartyl protease
MRILSHTFAVACALLIVGSWQLSVFSSGTGVASADLDLLLRQRSYLKLEEALRSGLSLSPADRVFFEGVMANRRNRAAESITLLQPLIPMLSASNKERAVVALSTLADDYEKTFQYAAAADTYADLAKNFEHYMSGRELDKVKLEAGRWGLLREAPAQSSTVAGPFTVEARRDRLGLMETSVTLAGQPVSMILDTGANLSAINRSTALRLGLKLSPAEASMEGMSGDRIPAHTAVVPELKIGKATFRNVAVIVVEDDDTFVPAMQYRLPASLGFPVLAALGRITFYPDGKFGVGLQPAADNLVKANLFLQRLTPIVSVGIRGKEELFVIDTGATGSFLSARYYNDHPHEFESQMVDEIALSGAGGSRNFAAYYLPHMTLELGGACVRLDDLPVFIEPRGIDDSFYGNIGQSALRSFPNYTFDFQNMSFTVGGPACRKSD